MTARVATCSSTDAAVALGRGATSCSAAGPQQPRPQPAPGAGRPARAGRYRWAVGALVSGRPRRPPPARRDGSAATAAAAAVAGRWAEHRAVPAVPVEGQRIYRLGELRHPTGVAGALRLAGDHDRERLVAWARGFLDETGMHALAPDDLLDRHLARGLRLWETDEPVSMAVVPPPAGGVSRIRFVSTPRSTAAGRRRACVAALSARVTADGAGCMLYTQLPNPTSKRCTEASATSASARPSWTASTPGAAGDRR